MTEVAGMMPPDHRIATVRHYEAAPPLGMELVEPGETYATTKEEEWVSKKKTEVTNTKQIETRVKRQVVLEDGKVVEDSGPMVTTNTTEDTETQEHHHTELRKLDPNDPDTEGPHDAVEDEVDNHIGGATIAMRTNGMVPVANPDGIVREVKERRVVSREETEEVKETEDVQHLGDITDEDFLAAIRSGAQDLRPVLRRSQDPLTGSAIVSTGPRLVRDTHQSKKVVDTEDTRELSCVREDGKIVTETQRTTEHEETKDEELPDDRPDVDVHKESSERYLKTREQEDVDYISNGVNVGHEMRFKTETMEVERRGDGVDEPDVFDSLSARARRRGNNKQPHRYRENGIPSSPLDRKDALTRRPLDFDQEEETRKMETSKWLEHHFGSDSRSSNNSIIDEEEEPPAPKTSFFNVTIKSTPSVEATPIPQKTYTTRVYSPVEPERERPAGVYYKGISEWSERRHEQRYSSDREPYHNQRASHSPSPSPYRHHPLYASDHRPHQRYSPSPDYHHRYSPPPSRQSPLPPHEYRPRHSPSPDYRPHRQHSPTPDYGRGGSPRRELVTPTPPQRKKGERHRQRIIEERSRYDSGYRSSRTEDYRDVKDQRMERLEEPPPDYSPPSPPPMPVEKKPVQKTRFAVDTPTKQQKSGNIIGQSIRKLVGKIRSASAERKARQQRAKRSPSPSYQPGHVIDNISSNGNGHTNGHHHGASNGHSAERPVQRYYLGEDPFAGSIYGRENKYDGVVRPARSSRRQGGSEERRSQSTLGRFSKSTGRLASGTTEVRNAQTLPRHLHKQSESTPSKLGNRSNSTINVSIINTPRKLEGPAKPARTYKSSLSRSKSFNVQAALEQDRADMYTSNPYLSKLGDSSIGLKSPGLISSLNRSHKDISQEDTYTTRFARNGTSDHVDRRGYMSSFKEKTPEYSDSWKPTSYSSPIRNGTGRTYNGDIYEPPTRLRDSMSPSQSIVRRGSTSSTDFSETYHTTTRNDDPVRPSITDTTKSFSKRTIPSRDGKSVETIQSSEMKSITKSHYRGGTPTRTFYEERKYANGNPVVIEVRNYRK